MKSFFEEETAEGQREVTVKENHRGTEDTKDHREERILGKMKSKAQRRKMHKRTQKTQNEFLVPGTWSVAKSSSTDY